MHSLGRGGGIFLVWFKNICIGNKVGYNRPIWKGQSSDLPKLQDTSQPICKILKLPSYKLQIFRTDRFSSLTFPTRTTGRFWNFEVCFGLQKMACRSVLGVGFFPFFHSSVHISRDHDLGQNRGYPPHVTYRDQNSATFKTLCTPPPPKTFTGASRQIVQRCCLIARLMCRKY